MAKKSQIATINAPAEFYFGSGSYALAFDAGKIVASERISGDAIHPSCIGPDRGSYSTNGGAAHAKAEAFRSAHADKEIRLAVGSCHEFMHLTAL